MSTFTSRAQRRNGGPGASIGYHLSRLEMDLEESSLHFSAATDPFRSCCLLPISLRCVRSAKDVAVHSDQPSL